MKRMDVSRIVCIADVRLAERLEAEIDRIGLREIWSTRGKQVALKARSVWQPFGRRLPMAESPSDIIRFYVPRQHERAVMIRLATAADLYLPGRGSIYAEDVALTGEGLQPWDEDKLCADQPSWVVENRMEPAPYDMIYCIVQRGRGAELARTMLEMGLCVPIVSFGEGMGMRDRLGLLRITIPQEKEILLFVVPPGDSDFVMDVAVRKANLHEPGNGFLCRVPVRALAVNSRMHLDRRKHVATMEQVISTLDQLRGSTDWRRMSAAARRHHGAEADGLVRFTLICEEGTSSAHVRAALDAGAGGATLSLLSRRAPDRREGEGEVAMTSRARECCDLVIPRALRESIEEAVTRAGLFAESSGGFIETGIVYDAITAAGR